MDDFRDLLDDDDSAGSSELAFDGDNITFDGDDMPFEIGQEIGAAPVVVVPAGPFLGMSAGERAFLSAMLFFNVLLLGMGLLLATGRLGG